MDITSVGGRHARCEASSLKSLLLSGMLLPALDRGAGPIGFLYGADIPGELVSDVHIVSSYLTLALIGLHIVGVTLSGLRERQNLIASMVDGFKRPGA